MTAKLGRNKYLIFDRDGTLIKHVHHLSKLSQIEFFPNSALALSKIQSLGFKFGIISNQSVIALNLLDQDTLDEIHNNITDHFAINNVYFDFILICPHKAEDMCTCRKPNILLGKKAVKDFNIDIEQSFYVGDQASDLEFALNLGISSIAIHNESLKGLSYAFFAHNMMEIYDWLKKSSRFAL